MLNPLVVDHKDINIVITALEHYRRELPLINVSTNYRVIRLIKNYKKLLEVE